MHNGFVNVDKEKMSKSLGNFVTLRDVSSATTPRRALLPAVGPLPRADRSSTPTSSRTAAWCSPGSSRPSAASTTSTQTLARLFQTLANEALPRVVAALDDDLNTPVVLAVLADIAKAGNELCDLAQRKKDPSIARNAPYVAGRLAKALVDITARLGLLQASGDVYTARTQAQRLALRGLTAEAIDQKIKDRADARASKDFARADALRTELTALAVEVFDSPTGTTWRLLA
jgi:cysteinyl-tRNA synthetase